LGIVALAFAQFFIGVTHIFFGSLLLFAGTSTSSAVPQVPEIYGSYTLVFGLLVLILTYGIWLSRSWGWNGTFAVSVFVIVADALTLLNLPSVPGIPKVAAAVEIGYSLMVLLYLSQTRVKAEQRPSM
jgi:uncharacterized membrane protein (DUF2068 family)